MTPWASRLRCDLSRDNLLPAEWFNTPIARLRVGATGRSRSVTLSLSGPVRATTGRKQEITSHASCSAATRFFVGGWLAHPQRPLAPRFSDRAFLLPNQKAPVPVYYVRSRLSAPVSARLSQRIARREAARTARAPARMELSDATALENPPA
jgi:hypothetical protein